MRTATVPMVLAVIFSLALDASAQDPLPAEAAESGLSVSVPLKELRALFADDQEKPTEAPVDVVFGAVAYTIDATERLATATVEAELTLPNEKWVLVPLGPGAGVTSVTIDDEPAPVVERDGALHALVDARKERAGKLKVEMQLPVRVQTDVSIMALPLMPAPIARLSLTVPIPNASVKVGDAAVRTEPAPAGTTAVATLPRAESVTIAWSPRDARPARVSAQQFAHVAVDRGVLRYRTTLQYNVQRAPVDQLRIGLPEGVEVTGVTGEHLADTTTDNEDAAEGAEDADNPRILTATLKEPTQGAVRLVVEYEQRLADDQLKTEVALLSPLDVASEQGFIGIEVRGNYELTPTVEGAERMDVVQLPDLLWSDARSPLRLGFRFDKPGAVVGLTLRPLQDLDVLIAMSDISEVNTTVTPEGKVITKVIMIVRNNQKSHMRLTLPEGATLWSAFVDDRPVNPAKDEQGNVLVPLRKSEAVDAQDEESYRAQREQRRQQGEQQKMQRLQRQLRPNEDEVSDLKPYDVELVYVSPAVELNERGTLELALPQVDVPIGHLAWGIFLPKQVRVVDQRGNMREVEAFSLPFPHFGEAGLGKLANQQAAKAQQQLQEELAQSADAERSRAKGVLPVRIEIPLTGTLYRFEKLLVVDEMPAVELTYTRRP